MFGIGMPELILIFVIALLVFGPQKLPEIAKNLGKALAEFKRTSDSLMEQVNAELRNLETEVESSPASEAEAGSSSGPAETAAAPSAGDREPSAVPAPAGDPAGPPLADLPQGAPASTDEAGLPARDSDAPLVAGPSAGNGAGARADEVADGEAQGRPSVQTTPRG